ncbi:MAG TPA: alpha/beta fold hydrolase, partial [Gammaproteobacteria bacterium]|nr:alpha/beta fold hydrolase [Gammaproteobacteria bacterium]
MNEILIFGYLFVDYNLKALYKPQEYAHASAATYLRNYWLEVIYILSKFLLYPLQWVNLSLNTRSENDTAILLVHGYCRNQTDWLWMRKQLQSTGCPIFCVNLKPMLGPIQEIAATSLAPKIAKIKEQTKCKHIVLIAHSMGGLVCGYYSEFMDDQNLIKAVIGIGTPFYGTKIAIAGPG